MANLLMRSAGLGGLGVIAMSDDTGLDLFKSYYFGVNEPVSPRSAGWAYSVVGVPEFEGVTFKERDGNPVDLPVDSSLPPLVAGQQQLANAIIGYYRTYYHREPDVPGLQWWVAQVLNGSHTLADVERAFQTTKDISPDPERSLTDYLAAQHVTPATQTATQVAKTVGTKAAQIGNDALSTIKANAKPLLIGGVILIGLSMMAKSK